MENSHLFTTPKVQPAALIVPAAPRRGTPRVSTLRNAANLHRKMPFHEHIRLLLGRDRYISTWGRRLSVSSTLATEHSWKYIYTTDYATTMFDATGNQLRNTTQFLQRLDWTWRRLSSRNSRVRNVNNCVQTIRRLLGSSLQHKSSYYSGRIHYNFCILYNFFNNLNNIWQYRGPITPNSYNEFVHMWWSTRDGHGYIHTTALWTGFLIASPRIGHAKTAKVRG